MLNYFYRKYICFYQITASEFHGKFGTNDPEEESTVKLLKERIE